MFIRRCFAAASAALLAGLMIVAAAAPPRGRLANTDTLQTAELLDRILQPRFQDDTTGVFGMNRVMLPVNGHRKVAPFLRNNFTPRFQAQTGAEKSLLARAHSLKRDYVIAFLHTTHVPGTFTGPQPPARRPGRRVRPSSRPASLSPLAVRDDERQAILHLWRANYPLASPAYDAFPDVRENMRRALQNTSTVAALEKAAIVALPRLRRGEKANLTVNSWFVALRPVRAAKESCLSCHTGAKRGDTLGVLVYAVGNGPASNKTAQR